jgi:hypothetical protein
MLSALGAAVFAAFGAAGRPSNGALSIAFAAAAGAAATGRAGWFPSPAAVGWATAAVAGVGLFRPRWSPLLAAAGGLLAGLWIAVLRAQGLPLVPALILATAVPAAAAWLVRRPVFAPPALLEEALLFVGGFALLLAVGGEVAAGWQAAGALAASPLAPSPAAGLKWLAAFTIACVAAGGLYSLLRKRRR